MWVKNYLCNFTSQDRLSVNSIIILDRYKKRHTNELDLEKNN